MKPDKHDRTDDLAQRSLAELQSPKIVGELDNPVLEAARCFWWRVFDRPCGCFWSLQLSIFDRIYGPDPATPVDLQREADHERWLGLSHDP